MTDQMERNKTLAVSVTDGMPDDLDWLKGKEYINEHDTTVGIGYKAEVEA